MEHPGPPLFKRRHSRIMIGSPTHSADTEVPAASTPAPAIWKNAPPVPPHRIAREIEPVLRRIEAYSVPAGTSAEQALIERLIRPIATDWSMPRDMDLVRAFVARHLPPGRIMVTPAGDHTAAIIETLKARPDLEIVGIIDRNAAKIQQTCGLPVYGDEAALEFSVDYVLLSHQEFESVIADRLRGKGFAPEKLMPIYTNPAYTAFCDRSFDRLGIEGTCDTVIVAFSAETNTVLTNEQIAAAFPGERIVRLFVGPSYFVSPTPFFPTYDLKRSSSWLARALKTLSPRNVYFQSTFQSAPVAWGLFIRQQAPRARHFVEFYDWILSLWPSFTQALFQYTEQQVADGIAAELLLARLSVAVVHKYGGPYWRPVARRLDGTLLQFFPETGAGSGAAAATTEDAADGDGNGPCRIFYAGTIPSPRAADMAQWNLAIINALDELSRIERCEVTVYNAYDRPDIMPELYEAYRRRYAGTRVRYHARVPFPVIAAEARRHHFGLMILDFDDEAPAYMELVCPSNKFLSYLWLNLPIIVAPEDVYPAMLTRHFGLGYVVPRAELARLAPRLSAAEKPRFLGNLQRFRRYMRRHNQVNFDRLRSLIESNLPHEAARLAPGRPEGIGR